MTISNIVGCPECDLLIDQPTLTPGQSSQCPRCKHVLSICREDYSQRAFSYALAALIFLTISLRFPFLALDSHGIENSMTLFQTVSLLADYGANTIAIIVFLIVILIPTFMLVLILIISASLSLRTFPQALIAVTRWLYRTSAWTMVDVFSIAVIVSLVKMLSMAHIEFGIAFWSYLVFAGLFLLALASLDRRTVWADISALRKLA
jgi:paraquat-inducible protein A